MSEASAPHRRFTLIAWGAVALILAVVVFGIPPRTILVVGLFLLCPLMMLGMHGAGHAHGDRAEEAHRHDSARGGDVP